jgi:hypothetical protein
MMVQDLYCSDSHFAVAKAKYLKNKWKLFGLCLPYKYEGPRYKKVLFDTTFDDLIPFNSMSGISYVAVKQSDMWGLIRFRIDHQAVYGKNILEKSLDNEPIDKKNVDIQGNEIKLIEEIKYPDFNYFKDKYHLGDPNPACHDDKEMFEELIELREWSDELKEYTKDTLTDFEFGIGFDGNVRMKRSDGSFGYIILGDALGRRYNVHHDEEDIVDEYKNTSEMVGDGWVLD